MSYCSLMKEMARTASELMNLIDQSIVLFALDASLRQTTCLCSVKVQMEGVMYLVIDSVCHSQSLKLQWILVAISAPLTLALHEWLRLLLLCLHLDQHH